MEGYHEYQSCIEACLKCAAICYTSAQLMSLGSERAKDICAMCAEICKACGEECSKHHNEHCQECAHACKQCAEECRRMSMATV